MVNFKFKTIILLIFTFIVIFGFGGIVNASNENIQILEKNTKDYIIYVKDNLDTDFEFAFSNDMSADKNTLTYYSAETDSPEANANKVAFVNSETVSLFSAPTYIWVRVGTNYILEGEEINLSKAINEYDLQKATTITKTIKVDTTKTNTKEEAIGEKKVKTTTGKVILTEEGDYSYILIEEPNSEEYVKLIDLATRISKFNSETDMYTQIQVYSEFLNIFNMLAPNESTEWKKVNENEILQPKDSQDGEKYILWIKQEENTTKKQKDAVASTIDVQFLTSYKKYSEEKRIETITTKLPVTYDNNTLLVVLAILVFAIIVVCIKIKMLSKKEK